MGTNKKQRLQTLAHHRVGLCEQMDARAIVASEFGEVLNCFRTAIVRMEDLNCSLAVKVLSDEYDRLIEIGTKKLEFDIAIEEIQQVKSAHEHTPDWLTPPDGVK